MTAQASASSFRPVAKGERRKRADLTLGVFSDGANWKVYSQFGSPAAYASRQDALVAAEDRAFEAVRAGRRVELFVEAEDGSLGQARLALH
jgi:hypothetical protein